MPVVSVKQNPGKCNNVRLQTRPRRGTEGFAIRSVFDHLPDPDRQDLDRPRRRRVAHDQRQRHRERPLAVGWDLGRRIDVKDSRTPGDVENAGLLKRRKGLLEPGTEGQLENMIASA